MRFDVRPMLESEAPWVRDTWTKTIDASDAKDSRNRPITINGRKRTVGAHQCPWLRLGGDGAVVNWAWYDMHRAWVRSLWPALEVLVATLPGHDEAVGWVAMTPAGDYPLVVHYAYTVDLESARRKGVARTLLRAALLGADNRAPRFSFVNGPGKSLLDAVLPDARAATIRGEVSMH